MNEEIETDRLQRRQIPFDKNYDYDDLELQRRYKIAPGVYKEYLNETTYVLAGKNVNGENDYQDDEEENNYQEYTNDYSDEEDYYKENSKK